MSSKFPDRCLISRTAFRRPSGRLQYTIRPDHLAGLHEIRPHISYRGFWDFDGFQESGRWHIDSHWEWSSGYEVHTGVNLTHEALKEPFEVRPDVVIPAGTYKNEEAQIVFNTDQGRPLSLALRMTAGGLFGGDILALTPTINFRRSERFTRDLGWGYNDVALPIQRHDRRPLHESAFLVAADGQHRSVRGLQRAAGVRPAGPARPDRSLIIKYSRLIDVFR